MHDYSQGCDEPNLSEFPFYRMSGKSCDTSVTVTLYEGVSLNPVTGNPTHRRFMLSCKEAGRRPTELDDEVLQGVISLAWIENGFTAIRFRFRRTMLLNFLEWDDSGDDHEKLDRALRIWRDVKLTYTNAWFDPRTGAEASIEFSFFSSIVDEPTIPGGKIKIYTVVWDDIILEKLRNSRVHSFDVRLYCRLRGVAKRMYRFLEGARHRSRNGLTYDLHQLATVNLGLTGDYVKKPVQIKRVIDNALEVLEREGRVLVEPPKVRYHKTSIGKWMITIRLTGDQAEQAALPSPAPRDPVEGGHPLSRELKALGMSSKRANELTSAKDADFDHIKGWIERVQTLSDAKTRNKGGYLYKAITEKWELPNPEPKSTPAATVPHHRAPETDDLDAYFDSLPPDEQARIQAEAELRYPEDIEAIYATYQHLPTQLPGAMRVVKRMVRDKYLRFLRAGAENS